ncbi:MAG: hypothetical protein LAT65_05855 [Saccharospirillum sp.]|nr:hypothetical protein [Saccharospirillum sp.]
MSDPTFTMRHDEWQQVLNSIGNIEKTLIRLEERENARDDRVETAQKTATQALTLAQQNHSRLNTVEVHIGNSSKTIDSWQGMAFSVIGKLTAAGVLAVAGYMIGVSAG